jgi:hypothetical protein
MAKKGRALRRGIAHYQGGTADVPHLDDEINEWRMNQLGTHVPHSAPVIDDATNEWMMGKLPTLNTPEARQQFIGEFADRLAWGATYGKMGIPLNFGGVARNTPDYLIRTNRIGPGGEILPAPGSRGAPIAPTMPAGAAKVPSADDWTALGTRINQLPARAPVTPSAGPSADDWTALGTRINQLPARAPVTPVGVEAPFTGPDGQQGNTDMAALKRGVVRYQGGTSDVTGATTDPSFDWLGQNRYTSGPLNRLAQTVGERATPSPNIEDRRGESGPSSLRSTIGMLSPGRPFTDLSNYISNRFGGQAQGMAAQAGYNDIRSPGYADGTSDVPEPSGRGAQIATPVSPAQITQSLWTTQQPSEPVSVPASVAPVAASPTLAAPAAPAAPARNAGDVARGILEDPNTSAFSHYIAGNLLAQHTDQRVQNVSTEPSPIEKLVKGLFGTQDDWKSIQERTGAAQRLKDPLVQKYLRTHEDALQEAEASPRAFAQKALTPEFQEHMKTSLANYANIVNNGASHTDAQGTINRPADNPASVAKAQTVSGATSAQAHAATEPHKYTRDEFIRIMTGMPIEQASMLFGNELMRMTDPKTQAARQFFGALGADLDKAVSDLQAAKTPSTIQKAEKLVAQRRKAYMDAQARFLGIEQKDVSIPEEK